MRYYCKNCGMEITVPKAGGLRPEAEPLRSGCPVCGKHGSHGKIPDFESVAQVEARTGRKYPPTAPVYTWLAERHEWACGSYAAIRTQTHNKNVYVAATGAGVPPDNWRKL